MTFLVVLHTCGLWLFVIPLYPARCIVCGMSRKYALLHDEHNVRMMLARLADFAILALVIVWMVRA